MKFMDAIYYKRNKKAIDERIKYLKKISVKKFVNVYLKSIINHSKSIEIIKESSEFADIILTDGKKKILIRYHRCDMVFCDQYETFLSLVEKYMVPKAVYLTCGKFEEKIYKNQRLGGMFTSYKITLIDGFQIAKNLTTTNGKWDQNCNNVEIFDFNML